MPLTVSMADKMRARARKVHCGPRGCRQIRANQKTRQPSDKTPSRRIECHPRRSWYAIRRRSHIARTAQAETSPNIDWRDHCQLAERAMEADSPRGGRSIPLTDRLKEESHLGRLEAYPTSGLRRRQAKTQVLVPDLFAVV